MIFIIILVYLIISIVTAKATFWYWQTKYGSIAVSEKNRDILIALAFGFLPIIGWLIAWPHIISFYRELK